MPFVFRKVLDHGTTNPIVARLSLQGAEVDVTDRKLALVPGDPRMSLVQLFQNADGPLVGSPGRLHVGGPLKITEVVIGRRQRGRSLLVVGLSFDQFHLNGQRPIEGDLGLFGPIGLAVEQAQVVMRES